MKTAMMVLSFAVLLVFTQSVEADYLDRTQKEERRAACTEEGIYKKIVDLKEIRSL